MATILVRPSKIQAGRSANQALTLTLAGAGWVQGTTTFSLSGVSGVTLSTSIVNETGLARLMLTTTTAGAGGTLTVSDGTNSGATNVTAIAPTYRRWFRGIRGPA